MEHTGAGERAAAQAMSKRRTVIFAGGGSGGHISPGLAIAERLCEIEPGAAPIFVCSSRPIDVSMLREAGREAAPMPAVPPSRRPLGALRFVRGYVQTRRAVMKLIRSRGVEHVVLLGGFVAGPAAAAAKACGVPRLLVNLDAPPGRANRWIARRCTTVVSAIAIPSMPRFASQIVGMPVRRCAIAPGDPPHCRAKLGMDPGAPTLLVTGASQGATSINELMLELARSEPGMFDGWQILHLTGHGADGAMRKAYREAGIRATVLAFLNEMGWAWGAADLAVSRAGANSVAEVARNAAPTLFLPYPYHADMHQRHNAQPLVDAGGAVMERDRIVARENAQHVGPVLRGLMADSARRCRMRRALRSQPSEDAALTIARLIVSPARIHQTSSR